MIERILAPQRLWVKVVVVFFTLFSAVGFTMFVFEEGMQTAMFAAFAYQAAKDWEGLERHLGIMRLVHRSSEIFIKYVGWLNPLMWPAYLTYLEANAGYILAVEARVHRALGR
jgi:hypothetical protein